MTVLPADFADLEPFADWCLPTQTGRYEKRLASTMPQMQDFYDAVAPRAEAAFAYCDQHSIDSLPPEAANLMALLNSLVMVSFPVEVWRQPRVPDTGVATLDCVSEPAT